MFPPYFLPKIFLLFTEMLVFIFFIPSTVFFTIFLAIAKESIDLPSLYFLEYNIESVSILAIPMNVRIVIGITISQNKGTPANNRTKIAMGRPIAK